MAEVARYKNVKFKSFVELAAMVEPGTKWFSDVTLKYDGTHLYGDVSIDVSPRTRASEFLAIASETLKF